MTTEGTLKALDHAIAGLCPCGTQPPAGETYCGDDCRPALGAGLPMPGVDDLVLTQTRTDDDGHTRRWYRRPGDRWHLQLDDGHRFVGMDVAERDLLESGEPAVWERLRCELAEARRRTSQEVSS